MNTPHPWPSCSLRTSRTSDGKLQRLGTRVKPARTKVLSALADWNSLLPGHT